MDYSKPQRCLDLHEEGVCSLELQASLSDPGVHLCGRDADHLGDHRCECGVQWPSGSC